MRGLFKGRRLSASSNRNNQWRAYVYHRRKYFPTCCLPTMVDRKRVPTCCLPTMSMNRAASTNSTTSRPKFSTCCSPPHAPRKPPRQDLAAPARRPFSDGQPASTAPKTFQDPLNKLPLVARLYISLPRESLLRPGEQPVLGHLADHQQKNVMRQPPETIALSIVDR